MTVKVLLYCHGQTRLPDNYYSALMYTLERNGLLDIGMELDSINISRDANPTIYADGDGNLPVQYRRAYDIVINTNCDHTGWISVHNPRYIRKVTNMYRNMIGALAYGGVLIDLADNPISISRDVIQSKLDRIIATVSTEYGLTVVRDSLAIGGEDFNFYVFNASV